MLKIRRCKPPTGSPRRHAIKGRTVLGFAAITLLGLVATACGSGTSSSQSGGGKSGGTLVVWTDTTREPGFQAYEKTHPGVHLSIQLASSTTQTAKIDLDNRIHKGWPDVVWDANVADGLWATDSQLSGNFAANLSPYIPKSVLSNYNKGALDVCTKNGQVYCLRNDLAQNVLWVNVKLMKKFGYKVPTTWQQYEQLGLEVAKQHPGYLVGTDGDGDADDVYMWGSECTPHSVSGNNVTIDLHTANCTRIFDLLNTLEKAGSMSTSQVTAPSFVKNDASKLLLEPDPNWAGLLLFKGPVGIPAGTLEAAPPLSWGNSPVADGDAGGGIYYVSSHLHGAQLKEAANLAVWMATNKKWQDSETTFPAYAPDDPSWIKANAGHYFAQSVGSLTSVMDNAAKEVWPGWDYVTYNEYYPQFVLDAYQAHKPIQDEISQWQSAMAASAHTFGYHVKVVNG